MRSRRFKNKVLAVNRIDQKPIWGDMTLSMPAPSAGEFVVMVRRRKALFGGDHLDRVHKKFPFQMPLLDSFPIPFHPIRETDVIKRGPHYSSSDIALKASSTVP